MKRAILFVGLVLLSFKGFAIDLQKVIGDLAATGVELEIHGIDSELGRYVGTYRSRTSFFDYQHFALTSEDPVIKAQFKTLKRHDRVMVKGAIPKLKRPLLHIVVTELVQISSGQLPGPEHQHGVKLPAELLGLSEITVKVHASDPSGRMLVVDYKESILPIMVPQSHQALAAKIDRGDLVTIQFLILEDPSWPVHLRVSDSAGALTIVEHMSDQHGSAITVEGDLILFLQSPQVKFNVFAVRKELGGGLAREYTIVNFEDPQLFLAIRDKLQAAWDANVETAVDNRNKFAKAGLRVKVSGTMNFVDQSQANPQILVNSLADVEVLGAKTSDH